MARAMLETGKGAGLDTDKLIKHFRSTKGGIWLVNAPECSPWGYMYLRGQAGFTTSNSNPFSSSAEDIPPKRTANFRAYGTAKHALSITSQQQRGHSPQGQGID